MKLFYKVIVLLIAVSFSLNAKDQIQIVGSSTVYPFVTLIAENFKNKNSQYKSPIVESTGTGGGIKMFCANAGLNGADITNASRVIKKTELEMCAKNGINNVIEINIGYDAIAIIAPKNLNNLSLSKEQLFLALARQVPDSKGDLINNPYKKWSEIDKALPDIAIKIMGPPSTSGTRDSFLELAFEPACKAMIKEGKLKVEKNREKQVCSAIRSDGPWINGGENDTLLIQKVSGSRDTLAILGYSYYAQAQKRVNAVSIEGIAPNKANFDSKKYPLFRPLFMYVKGDNIKHIAVLEAFLQEATSTSAMGRNGYLVRAGLLPLSASEYNEVRSKLK